MRLFQRLKLNQKGLSMVELICAVAILTVLGTTVSGILVVSANSYKRGSAETEVQQEAQLVANQIGDLIIDSTSNVEYSSNTLKIDQKDGSGYEIKYYESSDELKYKEKYAAGGSSTEQLLANNVSEFKVNAANFSKNGSVQMGITISEGANSYPAVFTITSRNAVPDNSAAEAGAAHVSTTVRRWLLEPNQSKDFASMASSSDSTAITWSVEGSNPAGSSTMTAAGVLTVGKDETASVLKVKATSASGASAFINVYVRRVTGISVAGSLADGDEYKEDAQYSLLSLFTGNSLNQITGATFDTDYVDTRTVSYDVDDHTKAHIDGNRLVLDVDLAAGEQVVVTATAKHPLRFNKSGIYYATVTGTWTLKNNATVNPDPYFEFFGGDDGWLRLSDQQQADITNIAGLIDALKELDPVKYANLSQNKHHFKVKYKPYGSAGDYTELSYAEVKGKVEGFGSNSINIRPIVSGYMEPLVDYDVRITWGFYDPSDPAGDITENDIWSFEFGQMVRRVSYAVESGFFNAEPKYAWTRGEAPIYNKVSNGEVIFTVRGDYITGLEQRNVIQGNNMLFILEKSLDNGATWTNENAFQKGLNAEAYVNKDITEKALYRVMTYIKNNSEYPLTMGIVDIDGESYIKMSNVGSGEGIFYFVVDPNATPTPKVVKPYVLSKGSGWGSGNNASIPYTIQFNEFPADKVVKIPYTGTLTGISQGHGDFEITFDADFVYFRYKGSDASKKIDWMCFTGNSAFTLK